jgi:hypothetical protein
MAGAGTLRLSWDDCDPIVTNMNWVTAQEYKLVLSVTDSDLPNNGHRTKVLIGSDIPEAWRFDSDGCQAGQLGVSHGAASKTCLAYQGAQPLGLNRYSYDPLTGKALLDISNTYDEFVPAPGDRYTLWQAIFNHGFSVPGDDDPSLYCRFAAQPLCFVLLVPTTEMLLVDGTKLPFDGADSEYATWEDPANSLGCPLATQARDATWGRVKGLYR